MRNRKVAAFFNRKSYAIAAAIVVVAAFGMTGIYYSQQGKKQEVQLAEEQKSEVQQAKAEDEAKEKAAQIKAEAEAKAKAEAEAKAKEKAKEKEETKAVSGMIEPENNDNFMDEPEAIAEVNAVVEPELSFDAASDLIWPLQGNVILNYSMDHSIYFASLNQYKYNPAIVIQASVNTPVKSVAAGKVTDISTNEETGTCITVDLGSGYSARYGQLKEIPKNTGDYIESGETIGYISEPTKYYSEEGANLYFQLMKDGVPVNPMEYLE